MDEYWLHQPESVFHHIWQHQLFDHTSLCTPSGDAIQLINPGSLNQSDGPDFRKATIRAAGMVWHGDVELHLNESDWFQHQHHKDHNYDAVVLHVFLHGGKKARCSNGSEPLRLDLMGRISKVLKPFVFNGMQSRLSCASSLHLISEEVILKQLNAALYRYFEDRIQLIQKEFDPSLPLSKAWKRALTIRLIEALGYQHNKEAFLITGRHFAELQSLTGTAGSFAREARKKAEALLKTGKIRWNYKSVRPGNHPNIRLKQSIDLALAIQNIDFSRFLKDDPTQSWKTICKEAGLNPTNSRMKKMRQLVYLPALYLLGSLLAHRSLGNRANQLWIKGNIPLPSLIQRSFKASGFTEKLQRHPGIYPQWKSYCKPSACEACNIFKKVIES